MGNIYPHLVLITILAYQKLSSCFRRQQSPMKIKLCSENQTKLTLRKVNQNGKSVKTSSPRLDEHA